MQPTSHHHHHQLLYCWAARSRLVAKGKKNSTAPPPYYYTGPALVSLSLYIESLIYRERESLLCYSMQQQIMYNYTTLQSTKLCVLWNSWWLTINS
jgi:hypothetical protein